MTEIFSLTDWQFWFQAGKFFLGTWLVWYLPGRFLVRLIPDLPANTPFIALRYVVGLVSWAVFSYFLGWLNLRPVLSVLCLIIAWFEIRRQKIQFSQPNLTNWPIWLVISLGLLIQMPAVFTSGWKTTYGFETYFTNAEDGMMHASFIQNLVQTFPPERPEAAGLNLTNYHFLSDLATAELVRVFDLPIMAVFFQFLPVLISILSGSLIFSLLLAWTKRKSAGYLGLLFWYLGGDLGYLMSQVLHGDWRWFAAAIDNGADQFLNPPQTFAKLIFLAALWFLNFGWEKPSKVSWWLSYGLFASLIGFKVYFGLFSLMALGLATVYRTFTKKAKLAEWSGLVLAGAVSLSLILPTSQAGSQLNYQPLAWPKLLFSATHLDWEWWYKKISTLQIGQNWLRTSSLNILAIIVSLGVIFGTRLVGLASLKLANFGSQTATWRWFWGPTSLLLMVLGLNTTQTPGGLNTFNFLVVATVPLIFLSAILLDGWFRSKKIWLIMLATIILILTPARSLRNAWHFSQAMLKHDSAGRMSLAEIEIASWLRENTQPQDIIQSHFDAAKTSQGTYLSFFSNRKTYLTGRNILGTHGITLPDRVEALTQAAAAPNYTSLQTILKPTGIKYYYVENAPGQKDFVDKTDVADHTVFSNSAGWIIKLYD